MRDIDSTAQSCAYNNNEESVERVSQDKHEAQGEDRTLKVKAKLYGLGAGPGDPELISLKALRILKEVECICCADSGRPGSLSRLLEFHGLSDKVMLLSFPMVRDRQRTQDNHEKIYAQLKAELDTGKRVAYLTLGDPSFYSTFSPLQARACADGYEVETVPGIISPCALAALANKSLVEGTDCLTVIPALDSSSLEQINDQALSIMKVKFSYPELIDTLKREGRLADAYMGVRVGLEGEELHTELEKTERPSSYFATINVPAVKGL